jgi:energy-coupling factor transporter ATP-binding protein EcfA2
MNKIDEIITIKSGMASYVDLHLELFDPDACRKRMSNYKPIKSHRDVFEMVSKSLEPRDRRCYLLTGSYGTGKSHLCLMLANYFMHQSGVPELKEFFSSYGEEDESRAKVLSQKRASGRYLVALPKYGSRGDFEELVLRSIDEALKREEFEEDLDSHFLEAIRRIETWKEKAESGKTRVNFYRLLEEELKDHYSSWTINKLVKGLKEFNHDALQVFMNAHINITTNEFSYSKDNLVDIISAINSTKKFQKRFKGIVIIFDEFGYLLPAGRFNENAFHAFSQLCTFGQKEWKGNQLIFIGTAHKSLSSYGKTTTMVDLSTLSDRINEVALQTEGMEDIISAIVTPQKKHELWQKYVEKNFSLFNQFTKDCNRLGIFDWLPAPHLRTKIIENIYPMHPMATYCLLILAKEIGSANRSVFTFFSTEFGIEEGSYPWFVKNTEIINSKGLLNLYTSDFLFLYFKDSLVSSNKEIRETSREHIKNYEATVKSLNKYIGQRKQGILFDEIDKLMDRILKVMLIHEITSINNNLENLVFSLNVSTKEQKKQLENRLKLLTRANIIYHNRINDIYEFKRSDLIDIDRMIDDFKSDEENYPKDIISSLNQFVPLDRELKYVEAKNYNLNHNEDKRLLRKFGTSNIISSNFKLDEKEMSFFEYLENEQKRQTDFKKSYEGVAIYIVCEDRESIDKARSLLINNQSKRIVIAVPKEPIALSEIIFNLSAIEFIKKSEKFEDFSTQDRAILNERESQYLEKLKEKRNKYLSSEYVEWHGRRGKKIEVDRSKDYDIANKVIEPLYYGCSNKFQHDEFNKIHNIKFDRNRNQALKEAVEKILNHFDPIIIDTEYANNRGEIRYLQRCLLNPGALRQIDKKGSKLYCEPERDLSKFGYNMPALAEMIKTIENLEEKKKLNINTFLNQYTQDYGQGLVALSLMFSLVHRYFGDNIRIRRDETVIGDMSIKQFEDIYDIITNQYPNAFLEHKEIAESERNFINQLYKIFSQEKIGTSEKVSLSQLYEIMRKWWIDLPSIVKNKDVYKSADNNLEEFIEVFETIETRDGYSFLLGDLQTIYGYEPDDLITDVKAATLLDKIKDDKNIIESFLKNIENDILRGVCEIFQIEGSTYNDIRKGIGEWFNSLDSYQRDTMADYHKNESKALITHLGSIENIGKTFFKDLPSSDLIGLGEVRDWITDKTSEYLQKIEVGKKIIEENEIKVDNAEYSLIGEYEKKGNHVQFTGKLSVVLKHKDPRIKIFITTDGSDPKSNYSHREEAIGQFELKTRENLELKYVTQNKDGCFSRVHSLSIINEDKKYEITLPAQQKIGEQRVIFCFPKSSNSLKVTIKSLLERAIENKIIEKKNLYNEIEKIVNEISEQ